MSSLSDFTAPTARPLPVLMLLDVSGSMKSEAKIDVLNTAVEDMLSTFSTEDISRAEIHVSVITFGNRVAEVHRSLTPATDLAWAPLHAAGNTPMGAALDLVTEIIEDRDQIPSRAYRPTIILVSDGRPNDEWEEPLERLLSSERASKAARFAMGIGSDAERPMLERFVANPSTPVFEAHEARQIQQFFAWVTMSVTQRLHSASPDSVVAMEPPPLDEFIF